MKKAMRKLRQKIADELAVMQAEQIPVGDWGEMPATPRGIQMGNIGAFEVVLKWIDEITGGKMNIDELEAGRELDAMIAKRVMGWNQVYYHDNELLGLPPETTAIWGEDTAPYLLPVLGYSTDIAAAHDIIEYLVAEGHFISIFWGPSISEHNFVSVLIVNAPLPSGDPICNTGETAPLAICRAALKFTEAMEGKENAHDQPTD